MERRKCKSFIVLLVLALLPLSAVLGSPYFLIDDEQQWIEAFSGSVMAGHIRPMEPWEWQEYMMHWYEDPEVEREGEPYPENEFMPAQLWVYPGGGQWEDPCTGEVYEYPRDAGLVMAWGVTEVQPLPEGSYSSAWRYEYGEDPDLRNCIIKVTVTPHSGCGINAVSFAIQDIFGFRRSWWWKTPQVIPYDQPTTVLIDTTKIGVGATTPVASGYAGHINFSLKNAQFFDVDENGQWIFGMQPVPPPGQMQFVGMWNYWHNLIVLPKTPSAKYHVKWSQPPVLFDADIPDLFFGWDEMSNYEWRPIVADDWLCKDDRPITDFHWWGSYLGWDQPYPPPVVPQAFHIGIWTDVPDPNPDDPRDFSHPGRLIWQNFCDNWVWNFAGYDQFPWPDQLVDLSSGDLTQEPEKKEACFQFNQLLSQDEWFYQEPDPDGIGRVYWVSIAAIYPAGAEPWHPWGWKTRPHFFNDDAVMIWDTVSPDGQPMWPPAIGAEWMEGNPIEIDGVSWDVAFELTTNEPGPKPVDVNPPIPDPLTWEQKPDAVATTVITMTATTANDPSGVEYYFDETSGNAGGDDSGWQDSSGYTDDGLMPDTTYTYQVRVRDKSPNQNQTAWSTAESDTTMPASADLNLDGIVDLVDLAIHADQWLTSGP